MRLPEGILEDDAHLEEGSNAITPDPDYDEIPAGIDNGAEAAFNREPDVDLIDSSSSSEPEIDDGMAHGVLNAPQAAGEHVIDELLRPYSPPLPRPAIGINNEPDVIVVSSSSSSESEMYDDRDNDELNPVLEAPQAAGDNSLVRALQPHIPPVNLPEPPARISNVSKSRKKNLRRKRKRRIEAQIENLPAKPYGHKRRSKKKKKNTQVPKCIVCLENPVTHGFVPCGHNCSCLRCATILGQRAIKRCPKCRADFTQFIAIYNEMA
ncbi:uncharacterized protein [Venturia canescens]|uniref:uncharacterized protein isoform X2 n=1 Tax=Venturia canescens TaxID=32260 RepID=UPI001C9CA32F|nr:uncharacterized protein LOC122414392 isoform X2 [Venturia canescens]